LDAGQLTRSNFFEREIRVLEAESRSEAESASAAQHDHFAAVRARAQQARRDAVTQRWLTQDYTRDAAEMRAVACDTWNRMEAFMNRRPTRAARAST
jgi:hypothetical protein